MDPRKLGLSEEDLAALGYRVAHRDRQRSDDAPPMGPGPLGGRVSGDPSARAWFWTLAILVGVGWVASSWQRMPAPVPANRPDTVFSSARAMSQLVEIAQAPRAPGSPEHARVRAYLSDRLRALGLDVELHTTTSLAVDSGAVTAATVRNLVARRPGTDPTGALVLTGHYDGAPISLGAGDDGVALASILETLRALGAGLPPLRNDLVIAITDAGELGSLGARALLDDHPWVADVDVVLSVDMRGVSGPALLLELQPDNGGIIETVDATVPGPAAYSALRALDGASLRETDLSAFVERGLAGVGLVSFGGRSAHHQAADRPINVSEATLQHHGSQLLALTRAFGRADLGPQSTLAGDSRAYLSLPFVGLVDHPTGWSTPATVGLVLGFALLVVLFRARLGDLRRAVGGLAFAVGVVGLSAVVGRTLVETLGGIHPEYGRVEGALYDDGLHALALVALVVALATGAYALTRRWLDRGEIFVGALVLPLAVAVWLSFTAPFAVTAIQIPLGLALLAALVIIALPPAGLRGPWVWLGMLAVTSGVPLVAVPSVEVLIGVMTLRSAELVAGAVGLGVLLLLPTFEWLIRPRAWWTPALALTAAGAALVMGNPAVQGDDRHPVPTSLIHLADDAITVEPGLPAGPTPAVVGALRADPVAGDSAPVRWVPGRWLTVPGVGEEWARSWVVGPAGEEGSPGPLLLPSEDRWIVAGTGADAQLGLPSVRVVDDVAEGGRRRLRLALAGGLQGEMVGIRLPDGASAELSAVNGRSWDRSSGPVRALTHWGRPEQGPLTVDVLVDPAETALAFDLVEHHLRPAELLGANFFQREDSVVADASTGSDRLIQRVRVTLPIS